VPPPKPGGEADDEIWDWDLVGATSQDDSAGVLILDDQLIKQLSKDERIEEAIPLGGEILMSAQPKQETLLAPCTLPEEAPSEEESQHADLEQPPVQLEDDEDDEGGADVEDPPALWPAREDTKDSTPLEAMPSEELEMRSKAAVEPPTEQTCTEVHRYEDELDDDSYKCNYCRTKFFEDADILSSNYVAMNGPGYLVRTCRNVRYATTTQRVNYISGSYSVQDVYCVKCDVQVGVTYVAADLIQNQVKVGKFLVDRYRLRLPPRRSHPKDPPKI
jgi:hypothetical protein